MAVPKPESVKSESKELVPISHDGGALSPAVKKMAMEIAKQEDIPLSGLTILGGNPYINVVGLDRKVKNLEADGFEKKGQYLARLQEPTKDNDYRAAYKCQIVLFLRKDFTETIKLLAEKNQLTPEVLKELTNIYTFTYEDEGWASYESVKMSTLKNPDIIAMMASRRASNRAKRAAVGCGLTSIDEMNIEVSPGYFVQDQQIEKEAIEAEMEETTESLEEAGTPEEAEKEEKSESEKEGQKTNSRKKTETPPPKKSASPPEGKKGQLGMFPTEEQKPKPIYLPEDEKLNKKFFAELKRAGIDRDEFKAYLLHFEKIGKENGKPTFTKLEIGLVEKMFDVWPQTIAHFAKWKASGEK